MEIESLLESLRSRVPWPVMSQIFKGRAIDKGRGWTDTIPKLVSYAAESDENQQQLEGILSSALADHIFAGEKTVSFFKLDADLCTRLAQGLEGYEVSESAFRNSFPCVLIGEELESQGDEPVLCKKENCDGSVVLTFCSKRLITERIEIQIEELDQDYARQCGLTEYQEIIGIKTHTKQFFDVVVVDPLTASVEIRVDSGRGLTSEFKQKSFRRVVDSLNSLSTECLGEEFELPLAENVFHLIDRLYRSDEGRVCELGFTTEGGSIKHEKMRRRSECLRQEVYHQAGAQAVDGNIAPYRIATTWSRVRSASLTTR